MPRDSKKRRSVASPLSVLIDVEKKLGQLPDSLRPRIVDQGPCGDGYAHRWSRMTIDVVEDGRFSLQSRHCLDCGYTVGSLREAASLKEAV